MEALNVKAKKRSRTVHVSVRAPENVVRGIDLLVDLGLFKDKSDFINYALQETLRKYLSNIKLNLTPEIVNKYFEAVKEASPKLSEEEILELLEEVRNERKIKSGS